LVGSEVTRTFAFVVADPATTTTTADPSTTTSLDSSGDGTGSGSTDTSGTLPTTGFDAFPLVLLGLGLVLAGSAALILGRRRSVLR